MYANYKIPITPTAVYQQFSESAFSSTKRAWKSIQVSVTKKENTRINTGHITKGMIEAQELSLTKIWDTPENDVWDDFYKELDA